jgi:hypothetical protein
MTNESPNSAINLNEIESLGYIVLPVSPGDARGRKCSVQQCQAPVSFCLTTNQVAASEPLMQDGEEFCDMHFTFRATELIERAVWKP